MSYVKATSGKNEGSLKEAVEFFHLKYKKMGRKLL